MGGGGPSGRVGGLGGEGLGGWRRRRERGWRRDASDW